MISQFSKANFRALTEDEICSTLSRHRAAQIGDVFDLHLKTTSSGEMLDIAAVDDIAHLIFNGTGPITLDLISLSSGLSPEEIGKLNPFDRTIALLKIFEATFESTSAEDLGERILVRLFGTGAKFSAAVSGSERH